ncbi:protein of unknown function DUF820 [Caldicellulosiruptor hydrothermalis 108]|uniref:Putative restriction endonuclease domain-containing protein n=1 Tax=Caldicellulosiruptor hydrothermalis (strain DSM 18901 / VKM B-2411 / 108) TaxID=632292 RepID=E4QE38_CALH1|nr:protein of unknown function DUF820 [Caldicellulosiruptor hydrothermalis 108]
MEARIPKIYTYADYLQLPQDVTVELIDGIIYDMSPAPSRIHQEIIFELTLVIGNYIKQNNKPCKIYTAPFDVILVAFCKNAQDERYQALHRIKKDWSPSS